MAEEFCGLVLLGQASACPSGYGDLKHELSRRLADSCGVRAIAAHYAGLRQQARLHAEPGAFFARQLEVLRK